MSWKLVEGEPRLSGRVGEMGGEDVNELESEEVALVREREGGRGFVPLRAGVNLLGALEQAMCTVSVPRWGAGSVGGGAGGFLG